MDNKKKCFSVNLESTQVEQLQNVKEKTGKSQNKILSESVEFGLNNASFFFQGKALFIVKVRIDVNSLAELGVKLQNGELKTDIILFTYCEKDDPTVGISLWIANDREHFNKLFAPHNEYYKEVIDIKEVVTPEESMQLIMASLQ